MVFLCINSLQDIFPTTLIELFVQGAEGYQFLIGYISNILKNYASAHRSAVSIPYRIYFQLLLPDQVQIVTVVSIPYRIYFQPVKSRWSGCLNICINSLQDIFPTSGRGQDTKTLNWYQFLIGYISNYPPVAGLIASKRYQFLIGYISNRKLPGGMSADVQYQFLIGYISNRKVQCR